MRKVALAAALVGGAVTSLSLAPLAGASGPGPWAVLAAEPSVAPPVAPSEAPSAVSTLADSVVFNKPTGTKTEQSAITDHVRDLTRRAAAGSDIRIALRSFLEPGLAEDLVEAKGRGVRIKVIVDHARTEGHPEWESLAKAFGTNRSKSSWVHRCTKGGACIGIGNASTHHHNKIFLFSSTGGRSNVVVQSSANISRTNRTRGWNNAITFVENPGLYNGYLGYFDDLARMRKNPDYYRTWTAGDARLHFFPRAPRPGHRGTDTATDSIYQELENVRCTGNTTVGTRDGRTVLRVAMFAFTRSLVARKLQELDDKGCYVSVVYTDASASTLERLKKPTANGGVDLWQYKDTRDGEEVEIYQHSKYLLVEGNYRGRPNQKITFTGSHNYSYVGLRGNDETLLEVDGAAVHDAYRANFLELRRAAYPGKQ